MHLNAISTQNYTNSKINFGAGYISLPPEIWESCGLNSKIVGAWEQRLPNGTSVDFYSPSSLNDSINFYNYDVYENNQVVKNGFFNLNDLDTQLINKDRLNSCLNECIKFLNNRLNQKRVINNN